MSLARAIETGDLTLLPSRRDEDWRWTDLRGLIRSLPKPPPIETQSIVVPAGETLHAETGVDPDPEDAEIRRVTVEVGDGGHLVLTERYFGIGDCFADVAVSITLGVNSSMERIVLTDNYNEAIVVSRADVALAPGATYAQTILTTGARRQRIETHIAHPGAGASARLDGVYLLQDKYHADITTVVTHAGVGGATDQLVKGVVRDQARGVFQGRIVVSPGADQTEARMGHHALVLSDRAEVDAKPELEIWADDVVCAHGNTVGALDEDALFYAQQRGIPAADARAMLTEAFVGEVVERIQDEAAREAARAWVASRSRPAS